MQELKHNTAFNKKLLIFQDQLHCFKTYFHHVQDLLRACRSACQGSSLKLLILNCNWKIESKFLIDRGLLCDQAPVTAALLMDTVRGTPCTSYRLVFHLCHKILFYPTESLILQQRIPQKGYHHVQLEYSKYTHRQPAERAKHNGQPLREYLLHIKWNLCNMSENIYLIHANSITFKQDLH